ncbi:Ig-like domain-containing protein [Rhodoferax sp. GW822-FHT02A01]|uniref:Ig-like domain-containing protein n=1 Tax=Rhodoferax sp. GW822-FHT02A01 TaxID=3141537 RepID=UPI00315CFE45
MAKTPCQVFSVSRSFALKLCALRFAALLSSVLVTVSLAACGGGGGGGNVGSGAGSTGGSNPTVASLSGVVAVGNPVVNAEVHVVCATGVAPPPSRTDANGNWQVVLNGQGLPCAAEASGGTVAGVPNSNVYHSVTISSATVNVTPLTDLLVANMVGNPSPSTWFSSLAGSSAGLSALTQTQADTALANLNAAFPTLPMYADGNNPFFSVFSPTPGNPQDDMLEALRVAMTNSGVSHASLLGSAAASQFSPPAALVTALATAYRSTGSGSTAVYFPVDLAFTTLQTSALTINMTGTYQGNTITLNQTNTPLNGPQTFAGQPALAASQTGYVSYQGNTVQLQPSTLYFGVAPYKSLGSVSSNSYTVFSNQIPLPRNATVGSSGRFSVGIDYTDATRSNSVDQFEESWSLQTGTAPGTANLCISVSATPTGATKGIPTTNITCLTIDTNGKILRLQSVGPVNGTTLTLTSTSITFPAPSVVSTTPLSGATGVAVTEPITLTLSVPVDVSTVTGTTFTLTSGGTPVTGTVSASGSTLTFTPSAPLAANTYYTATVSGNVKSQSGASLGNNYSWYFYTKNRVSVAATSPTPYSYPVALNAVVTATFSGTVDASTVNNSNFTVSDPSGPISGTVGYSGTTATFTPTTPLTVNTVYRATVSSSVKDVAGDPIAASRSWTFQTFAPGTATTPQPFTPIPSGLWQPAPGAVPSSGNFVYLQSDSGDYIGQGRAYTYTPLNAQLALHSSSGGVQVTINGNDWWSGNFVGPNSISQLQVGYYSGLIRYPFNNPVLGGLDWSGNGSGCNTLLGWFAVDSVTYANGAVTALDLRFEQQCDGSQNALHGFIHFGP